MSLLPQFIDAGLVDEFYFVIHPVIVGKGRQLLDINGLKEKLELKLVDKRVFKSGAIATHYIK